MVDLNIRCEVLINNTNIKDYIPDLPGEYFRSGAPNKGLGPPFWWGKSQGVRDKMEALDSKNLQIT
jgi:hypothetical protein